MARVLPYADFVFGNESEALAYGEANGFPTASVEEVALIVRKLIDAMKPEPKSELRPLGEMVDEDIARAQALGVHVNDL